GQPVPESNFSSDRNRTLPQAAQRYSPGSLLWAYSPVKARSVPFSRRTWYCAGVSSARHSASDLFTLLLVICWQSSLRRRSSTSLAHIVHLSAASVIERHPSKQTIQPPWSSVRWSQAILKDSFSFVPVPVWLLALRVG